MADQELFFPERSKIEKTHRQAPWLDFANYPIFEGDIIQHPSGEQGQVIFLPLHDDPADQWRVKYPDNDHPSRLCLQIGDKGQAVVIGHPLDHCELVSGKYEMPEDPSFEKLLKTAIEYNEKGIPFKFVGDGVIDLDN